jgi:hypothetical protein
LESHTGANRLLRDLIFRRRGGERQQHRRERDECDLKRRSAEGTIFVLFHGSVFVGLFPYKGKKPGGF